MVLYGCLQKNRCPRTPCLFCGPLCSPGAPRPTYRHLGVHIATRRYKLIRAKTLAKALPPAPTSRGDGAVTEDRLPVLPVMNGRAKGTGGLRPSSFPHPRLT
jgi:hypothetical protein